MTRTSKDVQEHGRKVCGVFSVEEAAAFLKKPRRTLYRWEAAGKMPARVTIRGIGGRRKLYRRADILAMAQRVSTSKPTE